MATLPGTTRFVRQHSVLRSAWRVGIVFGFRAHTTASAGRRKRWSDAGSASPKEPMGITGM